MSLEEKIGQLLLVGIEGTEVDEKTRDLLGKYHVGGFILYERNVKGAEQLLALLNRLKALNHMENGEKAIPLFLSVDEEGGKISRMPKEFTPLPANRKIGMINRVDFSYKIGRIIAKVLSSFGYNMDFAPVLDINSNPKNPVIGDRSFGDQVKVVTTLGVKTMEGIQAGKVIPVVKHFPGHGDTSVDSHDELPRVGKSLEELKTFELLPFKRAMENKADAVMVSHILLPEIDPDYPSSMSKKVIFHLLRQALHFEGVVITDDMTMGAIVKNFPIEKAAVQAVLAGSDLILVAHGHKEEVKVYEALKKAVEAGILSIERVDESLYRILSLKEKYQLRDSPISQVDVDGINREIQNLLKKYLPSP
ncbi:beta-N-acetylhexosaminidase [Thermicanus aegyptius]|uniref:beta-N-acetylhexosaminidase n=1 Tax=Thermicanus aegyptius TaxID=94009 RepID=UPI00034D7D3A|nr:beta-N-acetylhexosaminidase [Thermicanus aegyptius]